MATVLLEDDIVCSKVLLWVNYQVGINVRFWKCIGNVGEMTMEDFAQYLIDNLEPLYTGYMATQVIVDAIKVQKVNPPNSDEKTYLRGTAGVATATTLPRQAAGIVTLTTGIGGRKNRGRFYVPFPTEEMNEPSGSPNGAGIAAMEQLGSFYSTMQEVTGEDKAMQMMPVIVHRGPAPDAPTNVTGYIVRDKWATQKRRGDYGKLNARLS